MEQLTLQDIADACETQAGQPQRKPYRGHPKPKAQPLVGRRLIVAPEFRRWRQRFGAATTELLFDLIDLATETPGGLVLAQPLRSIATAAGSSKDTVRRTLRQLQSAGVVEPIELGLGALDMRAYLLHPETVGLSIAA